MDQLDKLENLKANHGELLQAFLNQNDADHLLNDGLFALLSQAMNDAYDCADTKDN